MYIWQLIVKGGYVMWPILVCSLISFAVFYERLSFYRSVKGKIKNEIINENERKLPLEEQKILLESAGNLFISRLQVHMNYLEVVITIAPLLGLLGTVSGMISSFNVFSVTEGQPYAITSGVSEALIATATGLCVAIIALALHTILMQQQNNIINELEKTCDQYIKEIVSDNYEV